MKDCRCDNNGPATMRIIVPCVAVYCLLTDPGTQHCAQVCNNRVTIIYHSRKQNSIGLSDTRNRSEVVVNYLPDLRKVTGTAVNDCRQIAQQPRKCSNTVRLRSPSVNRTTVDVICNRFKTIIKFNTCIF